MKKPKNLTTLEYARIAPRLVQNLSDYLEMFGIWVELDLAQS